MLLEKLDIFKEAGGGSVNKTCSHVEPTARARSRFISTPTRRMILSQRDRSDPYSTKNTLPNVEPPLAWARKSSSPWVKSGELLDVR